MKKTLVALAAAVALLGLVLVKRGCENKALSADAFAFDTTDKARVDSLCFYQGKDTAVLVKAQGRWLVLPDSFPADTAKASRLLNALLGLQNKEIVSRSPERAKEYGLDSTEARHAHWRAGKAVARTVIGKTSGTDYSSTYWKWEDKPEVYRTPGNFNWEIGIRPAEWKERSLFKLAAKDVKGLTVDWKDSLGKAHHYAVELVNDSTFRLAEPDSAPAKRAAVQDMLSRLADFGIDDFPAPGDSNLAKVRLDTPAVHMKVDLRNGKSAELKASRAMDNYEYARHPSRKDVVKLATWRLEPFRKKPFELVEPDTTKKAEEKKPGKKK